MYNDFVNYKKKGDEIIMQFFIILNESKELKVLLICVLLDTIFGVLRAIKERKLNSNVGIDGLIRKFGMMISVIFFMLIDFIIALNLIGFIPEEIRTAINIEAVGISTLFLYLFILYEALSILKNMIKCKIPIPKRLQKVLKELFMKYTDELKEERNEENAKTKTE